MKSWKRSPTHPDLARLIDCYWFLQREASDTGPQHPKLNPDPAAHLIIAPAEQDWHYQQAPETFDGCGSHWLFPHSHSFQMDHSRPFVILGIKFRVGALYALGIGPQRPLLDQVTAVDIQALSGQRAMDTHLLLTQAVQQSDDCCASLDALLLPWLTAATQDKHSRLVQNALPLLANTPIARLGEALHCTQRTLERSFLRVTGLTLKQCQSMNRLEAILETLYSQNTKDIDWTDLALRFGFSDQPHLIRHLKTTLGATPGEYAKQRDFTIDIYGDFKQQ